MFPIFPGVTLLGMAELGARQQKMDEMKLKDAQLQNQLLQAQVPAQLKALRDAQTQQRIGAEMQAGRLPQTLGLPSAQPMPQAPGAPMGAAPPPQPQIPGAQPVPGMAPQGAPAPAPGTPSMPMAAPPAPYASRGPQAQPQGGQPQGPTPGAPVPFHTNPEAPAIPATTQDAMGLIMQHRTIAEAIHSNPMLDAAFKNQVEGLRDWYNAHPNATVEELSAAMTNYDEKTAGLLQQESQARGHDTEAAASLVGAGLRLQSARETANIHAEATRDAARIHARALQGAGGGNTNDIAQMIADYKVPPPNAYAMRSPAGRAILEQVYAINPNYDATQYGVRQAGAKAFATGKEGAAIRSFNVAIDHLSTLGDLANALETGDNRAVNALSTAVSAWSGGTAPTNFDAAKQIVAKEVVKAIVAGGGGVTERQEAEKSISRANSPEQLAGVIQTYQKLMAGQLGGLRQQYEVTTGNTDFDTRLSPRTKKLIGAPAQGPQDAGAIPEGWTVTEH